MKWVAESPWDIAVQNQGGWAPKTGSFYTWVSLCGWAPLGRVVILYRSQGVKLELGGLRFILGLDWCIWCWGFLFYIDFHFMLDSRQGLGFNLCTMLKYTLKSSPCSYFSTVRLGGLDFTQMYTYIEYYRIIYNILIYIYIILIFWIFLESYGFFWNLLDCYSKKNIEKRIKKKQPHKKTLKNKHWQGPVYN